MRGPSNEELGCSGAIINSWGVAIDGVCGYILLTAWDVENGVRGSDLTSKGASKGGSSSTILGGGLECALNGLITNTREKPVKV